jgi:hypothetical protein
MSGFVDVPELEDGLHRLREDIVGGVWHRRFDALTNSHELDIGYRIAVATLHRAA